MSIQTRQQVPPFDSKQIEAIAKVLGDTDRGLTGAQIGHALASCWVPDPDPVGTKWRRIYNALAAFQNEHHVGNHVVVFITFAMNPAGYTKDHELFESRRASLNAILSLAGMEVGGDGKMHRVPAASSLAEAIERSNRLKAKLRQRNCHEDIFRYCEQEIVAQNCFHAVLEGCKSIASKVRRMSGLTSDGASLVDEAFAFKAGRTPPIAINSLATETLLGEQRGFANLLKGLFGTFRNPVAHEPKIEWDMPEQDALDILTMLSFVHRKLDSATPKP